MALFADWAGQKISVKVAKAEKTKLDSLYGESGDVYEAFIDPYERDEWHIFGSGRTPGDAVKSAKENWNKFDQDR